MQSTSFQSFVAASSWESSILSQLRRERRAEAEKSLETAKEVQGDVLSFFSQRILYFAQAGDQEEVAKFEKRLVRVTPEMNEEARKLLRLMGVPVVQVGR